MSDVQWHAVFWLVAFAFTVLVMLGCAALAGYVRWRCERPPYTRTTPNDRGPR